MVRGQTPLSIEALEGRTLLSGLIYNLVTNQSVYQVGQPVELIFTESNPTDTPITLPPIEPEAFTIWQDGTAVMEDAWPQFVSSEPVTWPAGKSIEVTQTWNGLSSSNPSNVLTGTFVAGYGPEDDPNEFTTTFQIGNTSNAAGSSTTTPVNPSPTEPLITAKVSTNRMTFSPGQNVRIAMSLTAPGADEKSLSADKIGLIPNPKVDGISVLHGSELIWRSARGVSIFHGRTIRPGQTIKSIVVWDGRPDQIGVKVLTPGKYTIQMFEDGFEASSTITIR